MSIARANSLAILPDGEGAEAGEPAKVLLITNTESLATIPVD